MRAGFHGSRVRREGRPALAVRGKVIPCPGSRRTPRRVIGVDASSDNWARAQSGLRYRVAPCRSPLDLATDHAETQLEHAEHWLRQHWQPRPWRVLSAASGARLPWQRTRASMAGWKARVGAQLRRAWGHLSMLGCAHPNECARCLGQRDTASACAVALAIKHLCADAKVDVYSYAMVVFEIICREIPFEEGPSAAR